MGAPNRCREAPRYGKQRVGRRERKKKRNKCINMTREESTTKALKLEVFLSRFGNLYGSTTLIPAFLRVENGPYSRSYGFYGTLRGVGRTGAAV